MRKNIFFLIFLLQFSVSVFASDFVNCEVVEIVVAGDQNGHVNLNCPVPIVGAPACATAGSYVGFDKSTIDGKHFLALATMALAMNFKLEGTVDRSVCSPYQGNVALLKALRVRR